ncbi:ROK family transcriptional regulator [Sphingobium sp. CR2-8]|uniref:ROK family transcriptional regulator n=1 Tax=Sphingobium sp. CR2-8 TaxID=1306534 RepID=UPI002DC0234A|nr:ROK family transcriptional regulator [Sphingobium sp. CR2-8]MEC3910028.1 ROK family transcriptional regulator [Sphingobium sp. CR2-8]
MPFKLYDGPTDRHHCVEILEGSSAISMEKLGSNATGVRRYNERLILATIRRRGETSKTDLSRLTGLSPQATVRIVDSLAADGMLIKSGKRLGGMGQPSILYRIDGSNGYTIGAEIGRDRLHCIMLDFDGAIIAKESWDIDFPDPLGASQTIRAFTEQNTHRLSASQRENFLGFGIAMPWFIGEWREEAGIKAEQAEAWSAADVEGVFRDQLSGQVYFENDGNAGALAELMCGAGLSLNNFLYVHIGNFVGGGLILGGEIVRGKNGNAGALASMSVPVGGGVDYLLHTASLYPVNAKRNGQPVPQDIWDAACVNSLAFTIINVNSLLDLEAVILGGVLPVSHLEQLRHQITERIKENAPRDFFHPQLLEGENGASAPARGAGLIPLYATYSPNLTALFNSGSSTASPASGQ